MASHGSCNASDLAFPSDVLGCSSFTFQAIRGVCRLSQNLLFCQWFSLGSCDRASARLRDAPVDARLTYAGPHTERVPDPRGAPLWRVMGGVFISLVGSPRVELNF